MNKILLSIIICTSCNSIVSAQDSTDKKAIFYWASLGGGICRTDKVSDITLGSNLEIALQKDKTVYLISYREGGEGFRNLLSSSNVRNKITSVEFSYGRVYRKNRLIAIVNAGPAFIKSTFKGELLESTGGCFFSSYTYEEKTAHGIGLALSAKLILATSKYFGLSFEPYANLNSASSFYGFNINLLFGNLRSSAKRYIKN